MKKFLSILLIVAISLVLSSSVFASEPVLSAPTPLEISSDEMLELAPFLEEDEYVFIKDEFQIEVSPQNDKSSREVTVLNVAIYGTYSYFSGAAAIIKAYQTGAEELILYTLSGTGNLYVDGAFQSCEDYEAGSSTGSKMLMAECRFFCFYDSGTTMVMTASGRVGTHAGFSSFTRSTVYTN